MFGVALSLFVRPFTTTRISPANRPTNPARLSETFHITLSSKLLAQHASTETRLPPACPFGVPYTRAHVFLPRYRVESAEALFLTV